MSKDSGEDGAKLQKSQHDRFLWLLTAWLIWGFMSLVVALFIWEIPAGNKEILVYMAGQLSGFTGAALALWTNTTVNSNRKTEIIAKASPVDLEKP